MATNLALDDGLVAKAKRLGQHKSKKDAVNTALREYIQRIQQLQIVDLFGEVEIDESYDYKKGRNR